MTLKELCEQAAVYTDRRDDFLTNEAGIYDPEDDPGIWFASMRQSINTAYREVARALLMPDVRKVQTLTEGGKLDLLKLEPGCQTVKGVYSEDGNTSKGFNFLTKYEIEVAGGKKDDKVLLHYHYVPDPLMELTDRPVFPESLVDPMIYISLAAADLWALERKTQISAYWLDYYRRLVGSLRSDMKSASHRRVRRAIFR